VCRGICTNEQVMLREPYFAFFLIQGVVLLRVFGIFNKRSIVSCVSNEHARGSGLNVRLNAVMMRCKQWACQN